MKFKVGQRVRLTADVTPLTSHAYLAAMLKRGATGTIHNAVHSAIGLYAVCFDGGEIVLIDTERLEHADQTAEIELLRAQLATLEAQAKTARAEMNRAYDRHGIDVMGLRAQLAARDAALDAVLELAKVASKMRSVNAGDDIIELLTKYGVHPHA